MQPGPNPEDINTILSRFQSWADRHPSEGNGNGNGHKNGAGTDSDEIREIPYEEAIREYRSRHGGQTTRRAAVPKARIRAGDSPKPAGQKLSVKTEPKPPAVEMEAENLPQWVAELPLVSACEPVTELKAVARTALPLVEETPQARTQFAMDFEERTGRHTASAAKRNATPRKPKTGATKQVLAAAKSEAAVAARASVPGAAIAAAPKPERKAAAKPAQVKVERPRVRQARPAPALPIPATREVATAPSSSRVRAKVSQRKPTSSIIKARISTGEKPCALRSATRRSVAASRARTHKTAHPPFHKVLANTVHRTKISAVAKKKKVAPDRTRRITTRFSAAEQRRIEKLAADADMTVSAYLRECALAMAASQNSLTLPSFTTRKARKSNPPEPAEYQQNAYSAPAPSLLGGWLSMLRNRFLGPPVRFSEQA
jgi:hypothetical protein